MTHFFRQGNAIISVLDERKAARYAAIANAYVGDGAKIDLLLIPKLSTVLEHPVVQGTIAQILSGSDLRLETSKLMAIEVGEDCRQGWHRDIPLGSEWLPENMAARLLAASASGEWWHNNLQCYMALNAAAFYWTIPGSNRHASSDQERAVFDPIIADQTHWKIQ